MIFGEWRQWLNNLSRNTRGRAAGRKRARSARPGLEVLEDRAVPTAGLTFVNDNWAFVADNDHNSMLSVGDTINTGDLTCVYGVDGFGTVATGSFTGSAAGAATIGDAILNTDAGGTVNVLNGNYFESNISVTKAVTIAGQSRDGVIVAPEFADDHTDSRFGGTVSNAFVIRSSGVTIQNLTIDGNGNDGLSGSENYRAAVITDNTVGNFGNVHVDQLAIENIYRRGVELRALNAHTTGNQITNSTFDNVGLAVADTSGGYAIVVIDGDALISDNVVTNSGAGVATNYATAAANAPQVTIQRNNISGVSLGMNLSGLATGSVIGGNTISGSGSDSIGILLQYATGLVTIDYNDVSGFQDGIYLYNLDQGGAPSHIVSNNTVHAPATVAGSRGIHLSSSSPFDTDNGLVKATLVGNTITEYETGISVVQGSQSVAVTFGAGNSVTGGTTGLLVNGANSTIVGATLSNLAFSGQSGNYVTLTNAAMDNLEIDGTSVSFNGVTGATATPAKLVAIEDRIHHTTDDSSLGFIRVKAGNVFVTQKSGSIQRGVDVAVARDTVNVAAGTYVENVLVNKSVALLGPNANVNPNTGVRGPEAIVVPATTDTAAGNVFTVTASDVTIKGFTIDGDNRSLSGGKVLNGVDVDAANGISNADTYIDGLRVENNIIQNLHKNGVLGDLTAVGGTPSGDNFIVNNRIDNLPAISPVRGRGVLVENNFYAEISGNVLTRVATGIQTNNFFKANPGAVARIADNQVEYSARGIFHNNHYQSASTWTISGNDITAEADATATNGGLFIYSIDGDVGVVVTDNDVTGAHFGIYIWNCPTTSTVTVSGGTLTGNDIGILVTNTDFAYPGGAATTAVISGVTIRDSVTAGVYVDGGSAAVNNNTISANGTGIHVTNGGSLTSVTENFITGNTGDGIHITATADSVAPVFNNNLSGNGGLAVNNQSATTVNASGNWWGASNGPTGLSGQVDYSPWLTTDIDVSAAPGFQGDFSELTVNATSPRNSGQTTGNLQEGIDQVTTGGTVNALAGTYLESVTVNKPVTVLGAQAGLNPTGRTNPALESIVSAPSGTNGFSIGASNVTIRGFTVTTAVDADPAFGIAETTQVTGTVIDRNIVSGFGGLGISLAAGSSGAAVTENDVSNNYAGIYLSTGASNATVRANVVHDHTGTGFDAGSGIVFEGNNTNVLVSENFIRDNAGSGIYVWHGFGNDFSGTKVTSNSITGNGAGFHITSFTAIDASGNWWGTGAAAGVAAEISGPVDYTPFLLTGEDFDLLTVGFQGNDTPVAVHDSASTLEGTPVTINVLTNDSDDENSPLTPVIVRLPRFGTVVVNADFTFTYTPAFGFTGTDSFSYKVSDGSLDSTSAKVNVTVDPLPHGVSIRGSELFVSGSDNFDRIVIRRQGTNGLLVTSLIDGHFESRVHSRLGGFTAIRINLHDGDDRVSIDPSLSLPVYVVGGLGNDTITTARGNDVVYGDGIDGSGDDDDHHGSGDGHDTIITGAGNDTVHAGNGNNYVDVGTGNNIVLGGSGVDQVRAGNGNNDIGVGDGDNNVRVGLGRNTIVVGNGANFIQAGNGRNSITAGDGANSISTGKGVDTIVVGDGANFIQAGHGNNSITAGNGANSISTGSGADVIRAGNGRNWVSSGAGNDRVELGDGGNYVLAGDGADVVITGAASDMIFGGAGADLLLSGAGNDNVQGGLGNDVLVGGEGSDYVAGEDGRDLLFAGDLLSTVSGTGDSLDQLLNQLRRLRQAWNPARGSLPTARPILSIFKLDQVNELTPATDQILGGAKADALWPDINDKDGLDQPIQ